MSLDELSGAGNRAGADAWPQPAALPPPAAGVALWIFPLACAPERLHELEALLSADELARAARFGRESLRERYVIGRATLRRLLGNALERPPAQVVIRRGLRGRPQADAAGALDFNLTHTAGVALLGIATQGRIGVDIERRDRVLNVDGVARKFMSSPERQQLSGLDADARRQTLLRLWTCKEAMSKATGDALAAPFRHMHIEVGGDLALRDGPPPYSPRDWRLVAASTPDALVATVALWSGTR